MRSAAALFTMRYVDSGIFSRQLKPHANMKCTHRAAARGARSTERPMTTHLVKSDASEHAVALFKEVFTASPDAIVVTDKAGVITAVNPASGRLFGYAESELIGSCVEILIPEQLRGRHPQYRSTYIARPGAPADVVRLWNCWGLRKKEVTPRRHHA